MIHQALIFGAIFCIAIPTIFFSVAKWMVS
jgi:hypothetical protein